MIKAIMTAILTVSLTVFLNPIAESLHNRLINGQKPVKTERSQKKGIVSGSASSSVLKSLSGLVFGAEPDYPPEVGCIVGEAEDQSYEGMLAIAGAIRNRGHLKGVYGCQSKRLPYVKRAIWLLADKAWKESAQVDITQGADHWHSIREPEAWWEKYGKLTVIIGDHKFYKEVYR